MPGGGSVAWVRDGRDIEWHVEGQPPPPVRVAYTRRGQPYAITRGATAAAPSSPAVLCGRRMEVLSPGYARELDIPPDEPRCRVCADRAGTGS